MNLANATAQTAHRDTARETAIVQNLDIVKNLARRLQRRLPPCITFDDLTSAGTVGLIEAVDRFDASRGLKLRSYAQHRIWGAMLDFLRTEDPLTRTERRHVRETLNATTCGMLPTTISLDDIPSRCFAIPATQPVLMMRSEFRKTRQCLSPRENRVIALVFDYGWQNREIASALHINESRVSQIKQAALSKLRSCIPSTETAA